MNDHLGWDGRVLHGVARLFLQWVPLLESQEGCRVHVCILRKRNALAEHFETRGIHVRCLGRSRFDPATLLDLLRLIRAEGIEVIHAQGYGASNFARLAGWITGVPVILHFHDTSPYYPWYQRLADAALNRRVAAALAVSERVRTHCLAHRSAKGLQRPGIQVLHNSVDVRKFRPASAQEAQAARARWGLPPAAPILGTVTRLYPSKGNQHLIRALPLVLARHPTVRLVIVGDGPQREELEELARRLGVEDRIVWTGFQSDVRPLLSAFDILAIASESAEGLPLTVLEGMAMGKPIVATEVVEAVENEVTGLVVQPGDARALAGAVCRLLEEPALGRRLGENARARSRNFATDAYVRRLANLYREVIRRGRLQRTLSAAAVGALTSGDLHDA